MLGVRRNGVNRMRPPRFESRITPGLVTVPACGTGHRHCPALRTVLKCWNGSAREENGFGGAGGIAAADSVGGRIARTAAPGGAFETRGPQPRGRSCARGACGFARAHRGRLDRKSVV